METARRSRSAGIDAVRVLGIGSVVFGHVYTGPLTHQFGYAWHVPLFFFITGYLWRRNRVLGTEAANRARTLVVPYIGWFALTTLLLSLDMLLTDGSVSFGAFVGPALGGANARGSYATFWFVSVLFFAAILHRLIERLPRAVVWTIAGLGLVSGYAFGGWLAATPFAIGSALPCLVFVVAGSAARELESRITHRVLVGAALIVVPLVLIGLIRPADIDIKQGLYGTPVLGVVFACAISFGLVLVAQAIRYPRTVSAVITELAMVGIAVVLFHPVVLTYARALGLPDFPVLVIVLCVPWAVALLLHRTRASRLLIGSPRLPWGALGRTG